MKNPDISVIIPCRNEERHIEKCVLSILSQELPDMDFEVIVVDGNSVDKTKEILTKISSMRDQRLRIVDNNKLFTPQGLNLGIRAARGNIIVRMDAHAECKKDYLFKCVQTLENVGSDVAGGVVVNCVSGNSRTARAIALITNHPFGVGGSPFRTWRTSGFADSVAFGAFQRSIFERIGLFDERLTRNQDIEMWGRIKEYGGKIFLDPSIQVFYFNQSSLKGFIKQALKTGMWVPITSKLRKKVMRWRHYIPFCFAIFVLFFIAAICFGYLTNSNELIALSVIGFMVYLVPCVVSSIHMCLGKSMVKGGIDVFPFVLSILPFYHFSYGVGSIWGIIMVLTNGYKYYIGEDVSLNPPKLLHNMQKKTTPEKKPSAHGDKELRNENYT